MGEFFQVVGGGVAGCVVAWLAFGLITLLAVQSSDIPDEVPWKVRMVGAISFILFAPYIFFRTGSVPRGIRFVAVDSDGNLCPCPDCEARRRRSGS